MPTLKINEGGIMFEKADEENCPLCQEPINITGLVGSNTNQCPSCNNPVFERFFRDIAVGRVFIDKVPGGKWVKLSEVKAVCVEDDSAFRIGETSQFVQYDRVFPY